MGSIPESSALDFARPVLGIQLIVTGAVKG